MLFDDDYNTYKETPFVTVEAASEQLLTGVLTNIHEFEMGLVLNEYRYLAEHGHEMALSEAEWWNQFKDNVKDLWMNAVSKIKEYFRNFAGWCSEMYDRAMKWLRTIGMTKDSASKAISAYKSRQNKANKVAKANGVLVSDTNELVQSMRANWRKSYIGYSEDELKKIDVSIDNLGLTRNALKMMEVSQFKGSANSTSRIEGQVKAEEFDIGEKAAQESYNLLFQYKDVIRSIKQMETDLIAGAEKELSSFKVSKSNKAPGVFSNASQKSKDDYRNQVKSIKTLIRMVSTMASTAIHIYRSSISTAIMVMRKIFAFNRDNDLEVNEDEQYRPTNASAIRDNHGLLALYDSMDY